MTVSNRLSGANNNSAAFKTPINNAILDPLQGFDADVWVVDQGTGNYNLVGRFTSIQLTVRNATEPYLEMNQRVPRLLDGEFQFGWVLERGMLDSRVLEQTFGFNSITRELRNNRNVRFQISFSVNAAELQDSDASLNSGTAASAGGSVTSDQTGSVYNQSRHSTGEYVLTFCKVDSFTIGVNAGRNVIANRWEGMCEGIEYVPRSLASPGVFLDSTRASDALSAAATSGSTINPFPWDSVLYTANQGSTTSTRSANPLTTSTVAGTTIVGPVQGATPPP